MGTLISPENHWALWAVLLSAGAFGLWAERTRWGEKLSGAVIAIAVAFALSNMRVIPASAPAYDVVWSFLVPLAIPLLLFNADLRRILREAGPTLIAFAAGAGGTILGVGVMFTLLPLGEEGWKLAGIFCATYVGGSLNYMATAEALRLRSGDLLAAGVAADNLAMALYFLVLFALPSMPRLRRRFVRRVLEGETRLAPEPSGPPIGVRGMAAALAVAATVCASGYGLADALGMKSSGILFVTVLIVTLATLFPSWLGALAGAHELGVLLMQVFFAVIGASASIALVLAHGTILFVFAMGILAVHLVAILVAGRLLRLDLAEIVIASNANMGGPTSAAAMAVARRWETLVIPAILCGTLGYAIATFIGVAVGHSLR
ncbi:MAG: DUF819 family protein [Acidobacteria bacterium]|nr:DUF819 family protein [Acidobacteriota bacterium]